MATQRFTVRLPERRVVHGTIAEFLLKRASDSAELARCARILAALAELPVRRRKELEEAVSEVCQAIATHGGTATVRFALSQRSGQRYVEVSVHDERPRSDDQAKSDHQTAAQPISDEAGVRSLQRLGEMLDHFDASVWPRRGAVIRMAQAISPAVAAPTESEVKRWAEMLRTRSAEDAMVLALQHSRSVSLKLSHAHDRESLRREFGDATAAENLALLSLVASKSRNLVSFMEAGGAITWVNEAFVEATAYSPLEARGKRLDELLFGPSTDEAAVRAYHQAFQNGQDLNQDYLLYRRDGRTFWAEIDLIPIRDENGDLTRWLSIGIDISQRRQTEESLRAAKMQAEASAQAKSEFLANMSHEIRTPMNAIIGMTELALTTELTREQRDYLRTIQSSSQSLLQLLNDILDLSKIEAGKLEIDTVDFNLAETISDTLKALAVKAHEKGLELAAHVPMDLPQDVCGDPVRLKQILFNLVGNAIKFTNRGEVVVDVESQWKTDDDIGLHFAVRDTGIGIPKEKLSKIFEAFIQADSAATRQYGGTGLGLTITAELVRLMQGKIWAESNVGRGSIFHFTLQLKLSNGQPPQVDPGDASQLAGKTVLVVDDNATNRQILDELLRHWQMLPTLADGASAALEQLQAATACEQPFDLVLLDALMPGVDGFQLAEMIRDRPDVKCGTVMMLSSADRPKSAARCRELGIVGYFVKPVSASGLLDAILTTLTQAGQLAGPSGERQSERPPVDRSPGDARPTRRLRVLVADDHEANRQLAATVLTKRGHRCTEATNGHEALAVLEREPFDIVLMDVQMPDMDGFAATAAIRDKEKATGQHLPIIALTAHAMKGDREKCLARGMDAYLAKPLRPRELVSLVESMIEANTAAEVAAVTKGDTATSGRETGSPPFDFDAALESMDNDMDLLVQQMQYFLHDAPQLVSQIAEAVDTGDVRQLALSAHRLRGLVARYSAQEATELASELEQRGENNDLDGAAAVCERLSPQVQQLVEAIERYVAVHVKES